MYNRNDIKHLIFNVIFVCLVFVSFNKFVNYFIILLFFFLTFFISNNELFFEFKMLGEKTMWLSVKRGREVLKVENH